MALATLINNEKIKKIDLLKIDVEGAEIEVMQGIKDTNWKIIKQIVIEVHDIQNALQLVTQKLNSHGFMVNIEENVALNQAGMNHYYVYGVKPSL